MTSLNTAIPGSVEAPDDFLGHIQDLLTDPAGRLCVSSGHIFAHASPDLLNGLLKAMAGEGPSTVEYLREVLGAQPGGERPSNADHPLGTFLVAGAAAAAGRNALLPIVVQRVAKTWKHGRRQRHLAKAAPDFTISRAAIGLRNNERAALAGMAHLYHEGRITWDAWCRFFCQLVWAGGQAEIAPPEAWARSRHIDDARKLVETVCRHLFSSHDHFLQLTAARLGDEAKANTELGLMIRSLINGGARWLAPNDVPSSTVFKTQRTPAALQIGGLRPGNVPLYFDGDESLATVAGPGTGKSVGQVIPNLLTFPGSCFVLDVKDELYQLTAGYRAKTFGPVYRFAPTDPTGCTHRYNPFDVIPRDAAAAERECQVIANMIIPENPNLQDPFWESKAREYLWALTMLVAFNSAPGWRHFGSVSRLFAMNTYFPDEADYLASKDTRPILDGLRDLGKRLGIPALGHAADAIYSSMANEKMLQAIFDSARAKLNPITRSPTALAAMQESDWTPLDLRRHPGTTVYLCLKPDEMRAYAPLVRLIFQQHVSQLTRSFAPKKGAPPVTFFLDEMPQLGYMANLPDIIDVGRGAGIRLWMFMQYTAQMREAYRTKAEGLIEACRVRCYMRPDTEAAKAIAPLLGQEHNLFSGEKKPLATAHELAGRAYEDAIVVVAAGEHPAHLSKLRHFEDPVLKARTQIPPPSIPPIARRVPAANAATRPQRQATASPTQPTNAPAPTGAPAKHVQFHSDPVIRPRNQ